MRKRENGAPVRYTELRRHSKARDGVLASGGRDEISVDLNIVVHVLRLYSHEQRSEPFAGIEVVASP